MAGSVCREAAGDCDLPEYCTGSSADCPDDGFQMNGTPCYNQARGYCHDGQCPTLLHHCWRLFGPGRPVYTAAIRLFKVQLCSKSRYFRPQAPRWDQTRVLTSTLKGFKVPTVGGAAAAIPPAQKSTYSHQLIRSFLWPEASLLDPGVRVILVPDRQVTRSLLIHVYLCRNLKCGSIYCGGGGGESITGKRAVYTLYGVKCHIPVDDDRTRSLDMVPNGTICGPDKVRRVAVAVCQRCLTSEVLLRTRRLFSGLPPLQMCGFICLRDEGGMCEKMQRQRGEPVTAVFEIPRSSQLKCNARLQSVLFQGVQSQGGVSLQSWLGSTALRHAVRRSTSSSRYTTLIWG